MFNALFLIFYKNFKHAKVYFVMIYPIKYFETERNILYINNFISDINIKIVITCELY